MRLDGTIDSWNPGAREIFGYADAEVIGRSVGLLLPADGRQALEHGLERARLGEATSGFEARHVGQGGRIIDVSVDVTPLRNERDEVASLAWIVRDVTAQKRAQEVNRLGDQFLSTVSEDMKTALARIACYAEQLESKGPHDALVEGLKEATRRLTEHLEQVRDYRASLGRPGRR